MYRYGMILLCLGWGSARAGLVVPPRVVSSGHQNDPLIHAGLLDATLYGADPSGQTDSTAAIQSAINDARDYALTTYLPAGQYTISDTLLGWEKFQVSGCVESVGNYGVNMPNEHYSNQAPQAPSLVGPPRGPRAVLRLVDHASGFGDPANPRPAVHLVNLYPDGGIAGYEGQNLPLSVGAFDCLFYAVVRDVDLVLGANAGAIGVQFYSAQMSYMQNVSVDATGAYAGIEGAPATSNWVNLAVTGGQYGILLDKVCGANTLAGITLSGQSAAGLSVSVCGSTTVAGFSIDETGGGVPVVMAPFAATPQMVDVALVDGQIRGGAAGQPAISNPGGVGLYAQNVFVASGGLIQSGSRPVVAGQGTNDLIVEYGYTDSATTGGTYAPSTSYDLINGQRGQAETVKLATGAAPADLVDRHLPGPLPWITDPGVVDVTTLGADPTGAADSTSAIQAALDTGRAVFLPRGSYAVSGTLQMGANTGLFGIPGMRSGLYGPNWSPQATLKPFLKTEDSPTGRAFLGDVWFHLPDVRTPNATSYDQTYLSAIDWRVGRSSVANEVSVSNPWTASTDTTSAPRQFVRIEGSGGGKWYGLQQANNGRASNAALRFLEVEGTSAPLTFYGMNLEHAQSDSFMTVDSASNVRVLASKTECRQSWEQIIGSRNVQLAGLNGDWHSGTANPGVLVSNSQDVVLSGLGWYGITAPPTFIVQQVGAGGVDAGISFADGVSLFVTGTFDETPFPFCGDGVCDGAETATNCPADCAADGGVISDAGTGTDAGTAADAGAVTDAGTPPDASVVTTDAGRVVDAGPTVAPPTTQGPTAPSDDVRGGCGCRETGNTPLVLLAVALILARRRTSAA